MSVTVDVRGWESWPDVRGEWAGLVNAAPDCSVFLSEPWVSSWIEVFGPVLRPLIVTFRRGAHTVGACLIVRTLERRSIVPVTVAHLNTAGEGSDSPCVEYNGLVALEPLRTEVAHALRDYLSAQSWDELVLSGITAGTWSAVLAADGPVRVRARPSYFVDLKQLRDSATDYIATLSSRTRARVRQSIRAYEAAAGPLSVTAARTVRNANRYLDELATLHRKRWEARGDSGSFASPRFMDFHRRMLERGVECGLVDLLRVTAGDQTIGLLYNFVHRNRVYFYQCGYHYGDDRRLQPGMVALCAAVRYYTDAGLDEFDFLAGDSEYKRALGQSARELQWLTIERGTLKTRAIAVLRQLKQRARPA